MIEQSKKNGPLYLAELLNGKFISKKVTVDEVEFGKPTPITLMYRTIDLYAVVKGTTGYIFENGQLTKTVENPQPIGRVVSFMYGTCYYEGRKHCYLIKNTPTVSRDEVRAIDEFELPGSFTGYPYEQEFTYPDEVYTLFGDFPATYVNKYKRPLNPELMKSGLFLPIGIDMVKTTLNDLKDFPQFPRVVNLSGTEYAVLDLEPGYTSADEEEVAKYEVIYSEDTPRGGKHLFVKTKDDAFKYRISPTLEIVNDTMITLYGINARVHNMTADYVTFKDAGYKEIGGIANIVTTQATQEIAPIATTVRDFILDLDKPFPQLDGNITFGEQAANQEYKLRSSDESEAEYMALLRLYQYDVKPLFKRTSRSDRKINIRDFGKTLDIEKDDIPWLLAEYGKFVIPHREKHETERQGVPFLVYLATKIVQTN